MAQILTVCDIFGALAEKRSYRKPQTPEQAIQILMGMAQFGKVNYGVLCTLARAVGVENSDKRSGAPVSSEHSLMVSRASTWPLLV
nr:hypothetical protein [Pararhizobium sp. IMCC3301]